MYFALHVFLFKLRVFECISLYIIWMYLRDVYMEQAEPDKELVRLTELDFIRSLHEKC